MRTILIKSVAITALALFPGFASAQGAGGAEHGGAEHGGAGPGAPGGAGAGGERGAPMQGGGGGMQKQGAEGGMQKQGTGGMQKEGAGGMQKEGAGGMQKEGAGGGAMQRPGAEGGVQRKEGMERGPEGGKMNAETEKGGHQAGPGHAPQISSGQRTKATSTIRSSIRSHHIDSIRHVDFPVNVGTFVPARYHYYPLPPEVIEIVPEYRGYDYIYVDDEILILDPVTHAIVYIL